MPGWGGPKNQPLRRPAVAGVALRSARSWPWRKRRCWPMRSMCCALFRKRPRPQASATWGLPKSDAPNGRKMPMTKIETFDSGWDAVADMSGQAASLRARVEFMRQIAAVIEGNDWTPSEAAMHCGVAPPRSDDLLRGRGSRGCLGALVTSATAMGRRVHMELQAA